MSRQASAERFMATVPILLRVAVLGPLIATYHWDKAFRDFKLSNAKKQEFVGKGLESIERALQLRPDYIEAFVYKGLLLRLQANLEPDPLRQQELIREADELRDRAQQLRQTQPGASRPWR